MSRPKPNACRGHVLLGQWLIRAKLTQAEAADYIGISRVSFNQTVNFLTLPTLISAIRIEDVTGIGVRNWLIPASLNNLSYGEPNMHGENSSMGVRGVNNNPDYRTQNEEFEQ